MIKRFFMGLLSPALSASLVSAQSLPVDQLPNRALTSIVGSDASGYVGKMPVTVYDAVAQGGMVGDGVTDNSSLMTAACAYAETNNRTLEVPDGNFLLVSPVQCDAHVRASPNAIFTAGTTGMAYVISVGNPSKLVRDKSWHGGIIDARNKAVDGFFVRYAYHYEVEGLYVSNQTGKAINVGETGTSTPSYEVLLSSIHVHRANGYWDAGLPCTIPKDSVGIYWGNVTDSRVDLAEIVSNDIGVWTNTGSVINSRVHPWPRTSCGTMSVAFKDSGVGNTYIAPHADTPSQYGFWFNSTVPQSTVINPRLTMNRNDLTNAIGFYFSQTALPQVTITDAQFGDASSGGGFASDFQTKSGGALDATFVSAARYYPTTAVKGSKYLSKTNMPGMAKTCIRGVTNTTVLFGSGASTFTVPDCFTSLTKIEAIGAGGNVASGNTIGGAGGGAYASITSYGAFTANAVLNYQLGTPGGTQGTGSGASGTADTWFGSNATLLAQGGQSTTTSAGGAGGTTAASVGTVTNAGGAGGTSFSGGSGGGGAGGAGGVGGAGGAGASSKGGGGGGGAGSTAAGSNGGSGSTGIGGAGGATGGGQGGQGWQAAGTPAADGYLPTTYAITTYGGSIGAGGGGGGGGGGTNQAAGNGQTCGGGAGGSGTLGSGLATRLGGGGCIIITYVQ